MTTDEQLGQDLEQIAPAPIPSNFAYLQSLIQQLPTPLAPDIKAAASGQAITVDPGQTASGQLTNSLIGASIGTESGASIGGYSGTLFYGNANLLLNPMIDNTYPTAMAAASTDYQWGNKWHCYYALNSGSVGTNNPTLQPGYDRITPNDNPFNTNMPFMVLYSDTGGVDLDAIVYHEGWNPSGLDPALAYLVGSLKILSDGHDADTTTLQCRIEIASYDGSTIKAAGPWFDLLNADVNQPYQITAAYPHPAGGWWAENFRLQLHVQYVSTAFGSELIDFGEPILALSASQTPPPFAPIAAKWIPAELRVYNTPGNEILRVGEEYSGHAGSSSDGAEIEWSSPTTGLPEARLRRNAAGELAWYAYSGIKSVLRLMSANQEASLFAQITSDTYGRARVRGDATESSLTFGPGGASPFDVAMLRAAAGTMQITDAGAGNGARLDVRAPTGQRAYVTLGLAADSASRVAISGDATEVGMQLGGGSTRDLRMYRSGTHELTIDDTAGGAVGVHMGNFLGVDNSSYAAFTVGTKTGAQLFCDYGTGGTNIIRIGMKDTGGTFREGIRFNGATTAPNIGFFGFTGTTKQTITGSRGGNAALASLLTALAAHGLITNSTSA